jgi:hypothetical protein
MTATATSDLRCIERLPVDDAINNCLRCYPRSCLSS